MKTTYLTFKNIKIYIKENEHNEVVSIGRVFINPSHYPDTQILSHNSKEVYNYLHHNTKNFDLKLHVEGTPFQRQVWDVLKTIPYGDVWTYKMVAGAMGDEKKVRAVANAIGKNQHMILVPCHRVIGSDGKMHGFAGGIDLKEVLLNIERSL